MSHAGTGKAQFGREQRDGSAAHHSGRLMGQNVGSLLEMEYYAVI